MRCIIQIEFHKNKQEQFECRKYRKKWKIRKKENDDNDWDLADTIMKI